VPKNCPKEERIALLSRFGLLNHPPHDDISFTEKCLLQSEEEEEEEEGSTGRCEGSLKPLAALVDFDQIWREDRRYERGPTVDRCCRACFRSLALAPRAN